LIDTGRLMGPSILKCALHWFILKKMYISVTFLVSGMCNVHNNSHKGRNNGLL
jgi:hypothetical protein